MESARPAKWFREWVPRLWLGCDLFAWLRLIWMGRFSFGWRQFRLLPIGTLFALAHTFLRYAQTGLHGQRIRETRIAHPPLFIIGHWRSGTTLLHELLVLDPRHTFPDTYYCFDPCHPLLTENGVKTYFNWMLPEKRFMDNMPIGWSRPQEDEFALALLGAPSPYLDMAFPNQSPLEPESLDLDRLPPHRRAQWKRTLLRFLQTITLRDPRRLVLKSPPHTCRIPTLLELFPDARFIHIVRDPIAVYSSTVNLWRKLYDNQGFHTPNVPDLEERVFTTFLHFHDRLEATRSLVPPEHFHELRFEDLTKDPIAELRRLYERLGLGDFNVLRPHLEKYLAENARYERNKWQPTDEQVRTITERWGRVMERYGYK